MEHISVSDFRNALSHAESIKIVKRNAKFSHFNLHKSLEKELQKYTPSSNAKCTSFYNDCEVSDLQVLSFNEAIIRFSNNTYIEYFNRQHFRNGNMLAMVDYEFVDDTFRAMIFEIIS